MKLKKILIPVILLFLVAATLVCTLPAFAAGSVRGDMNDDTKVDIDDAIYLLRHTMLPNRYPLTQAGDVNGDDNVNIDDAIYLLRHTMLPSRYPIVEAHNYVTTTVEGTCTTTGYTSYSCQDCQKVKWENIVIPQGHTGNLSCSVCGEDYFNEVAALIIAQSDNTSSPYSYAYTWQADNGTNFYFQFTYFAANHTIMLQVQSLDYTFTLALNDTLGKYPYSFVYEDSFSSKYDKIMSGTVTASTFSLNTTFLPYTETNDTSPAFNTVGLQHFHQLVSHFNLFMNLNTIDVNIHNIGFTNIDCMDYKEMGARYELSSYTPATCTSEGSFVYTSSLSSYPKTEIIPMESHNYEEIPGREGYITTSCRKCGDLVETPIPYMLSYTLNGGTATNPATFNIETCSFALQNPTREGYTFLGWTGTDLSEPTLSVELPTGSVGNRSYIANWDANTYTVTYDADGGICDTFFDEVTFDASFDLPTASRAGYDFDGWYIGDNKMTGKAWKIANDETLIAKWIPHTDIKYVVNHYQENIDNDDYTLYESKNLIGTAGEAITPSVYTFTGFTSPATKTVTIEGDGSLVVDYYYTRNTYTITFITNGGTAISPIIQKYQSTASIPDATRTDFTFGGWFTNKALSLAFTDTEIVIDTKNITLYAWWTEENKPTDFSYNGSYEITIEKYIGTSKIMSIPAYIGGKAVITIADYAFSSNTSILKAKMPDTITSVGEYAFYGCKNLADIRLSNRLKSISYAMFYNCTALKSIKVPNSVKKLEGDAFRQCAALETVELGTGITEIAIGAFFNDSNIKRVNITDLAAFCKITGGGGLLYVNSEVKLYFNDAAVTDLVIPSTVKKINDDCAVFRGYCALESLTLHDQITAIGNDAFSGCSNLKTVNLGNGVKTIGVRSFLDCVNLTVISGGANLESISGVAFFGCSNLKSFTVGRQVTLIGTNAFNGCSNLSEVIFEDTAVWYVEKSDTIKELSQEKLSEAETAAKYLRSTYCSYMWTKE